MPFVKLDTNILTSSVWAEDPPTIKVWIYLLAAADSGGVVRATVPAIALQCGLDLAVVRAAIEKFAAPDGDSRTSRHEGRRIRIDREPKFEIHLLNFEVYRKKDHTAAARQRRHREALKRHGVTGRDSRDSHKGACDGHSGSRGVTQAEAEAEAETTETETKEKTAAGAAIPPEELHLEGQDASAANGAGFERWWQLYRQGTGRGTDKAETKQAYDRLSSADKLALYDRTTKWFAARSLLEAAKEFVPAAPDPKRFIKKRKWEDELTVPPGKGARSLALRAGLDDERRKQFAELDEQLAKEGSSG